MYSIKSSKKIIMISCLFLLILSLLSVMGHAVGIEQPVADISEFELALANADVETITLTSNIDASLVDWTIQVGAKIITSAGNQTLTLPKIVTMQNAVTFESITLTAFADANGTTIYAGGHPFVLGNGVTSYVYAVAPLTTRMTVYGGSQSGVVAGNTGITMKSGRVEYIYGGGENDTATVNGDTYIIISGGTVYMDLYGGGKAGAVAGSTNISVGGNVRNALYGGGAASTAATSTVGNGTNITVTGGTQGTIYGGSYSAASATPAGNVTGNTRIEISGATTKMGTVYGGGNYSAVNGSSTIIVSGGATSTGNIFADGNVDGPITGGAAIDINNGNIASVYGYNSNSSGDVSITINNSKITTFVGGIYNANVTNVNTNIDIKGTTTIGANVYGGSATTSASSTYGKITGNTQVTISGTAVITGNVFGGSCKAPVNGNTSVTINGGTIKGNYTTSDTTGHGADDANNGGVYGGGNGLGSSNLPNAYVSGRSSVVINGGTIERNVYGGGRGATAKVDLDTQVIVNGGTIANVYGGGYNQNASGDCINTGSKLTINGGSITTSAYGGGYYSSINGGTDVVVSGGIIGYGAYGGGRGGSITGDTRLEIKNNAQIGSAAATNTLFVYSGGTNSTIIGNAYLLIHENAKILTGSTSSGVLIGSGNYNTIKGSTYVDIKGNADISYSGTSLMYIMGGQSSGTIEGSSYLTISENAKISSTTAVVNVFGGSNETSTVMGNAYAEISSPANVSGKYLYLSGGGYSYNNYMHYIPTLKGSANLTLNSVDITATIFGGVASYSTTGTTAGIAVGNGAYTTINGGKITGNVYGGMHLNSTLNGGTHLLINNAYIKGNVYGAGDAYYDRLTGGTDIVLNGGTVEGSVFGACYRSADSTGYSLDGGMHITINGTTVTGSVYGAGNNSYNPINDGTYITMNSGTVKGEIYGGGVTPYYTTVINGGTHIELNGGIVESNVYAASNNTASGKLDTINGGTLVTMSGGTVYGTVYGTGKSTIPVGKTLLYKNIGSDSQPATISGRLSDFDNLEIDNAIITLPALPTLFTRIANIKLTGGELRIPNDLSIAGATVTTLQGGNGVLVLDKDKTLTVGGTVAPAIKSKMSTKGKLDEAFVRASSGKTVTASDFEPLEYYGVEQSDSGGSRVRIFTDTPKYTLTFDAMGGNPTPNTQIVYDSQTFTQPLINPEKLGYNFMGWYINVNDANAYNFSTPANNDINLFAKWVGVEYDVTFKNNNGTSDINTRTEYLNRIQRPVDPSKLGYLFDGWWTTATFEPNTQWLFDTNLVTGNTTLYARWISSPDSPIYPVNFETNGAEQLLSDIAVPEGAKINPPYVTKTGNVLEGWYTQPGFVMRWDFANMTVMNGMTLYANWIESQEPAKTFWTVSFVTNGANQTLSDILILDGGKMNQPNVTKSGNTIEGWYTEPGFVNKWDFQTKSVTQDTILYAKWIVEAPPADQFYTVIFITNGAEQSLNPIAVIPNQKVNPPYVTKAGYTLEGWYKEESFNNKWDFASMTVTQNTTLYAKWVEIINPPTLEFWTVSFVTNGADQTLNAITTFDGNKINPPNVTKAASTLEGWYTEPEFINKWDFQTQGVTNNTTLYANWVAYTPPEDDFYHVIFETNGSDQPLNPISALSGEKINQPYVAKAGNTLEGWYTEEEFTNKWDFATMAVTHDVNLYAKWVEIITPPTEQEWTVTYETNGANEMLHSISVLDDHRINRPDVTKDDHYLEGWYTEPEFANKWVFSSQTVTQNMTLYANWIMGTPPISEQFFDVLFETDGAKETLDRAVVLLGEKINEPHVSKAGYKLDGWYTEPEFMNIWEFMTDTVSDNVTLYAKWSVSTVIPSGQEWVMTFQSNGSDQILNKISVPNGEKINQPYVTKSGYTIAGWYKDEAFTTAWNFAADTATQDATIYAKWNVYSGGGGSPTNNQAILTIKGVDEKETEFYSKSSIVNIGATESVNAPYIAGYVLDDEITKSVTIKSGSNIITFHYDKVPQGRFELDKKIKYINGYGDGAFYPDLGLTRAEVSNIFYKLIIDDNKTTPLTSTFSDVASNLWYNQPVSYLAKNGIINGYEDGTFNPEGSISRAEFVKIAAQFNKLDTEFNNVFNDVPNSHWAARSIAIANGNGWVLGLPDGTFAPDKGITRAEGVTIINRMISRTLTSVPSDAPVYSDVTPAHWAYYNIIAASIDMP